MWIRRIVIASALELQTSGESRAPTLDLPMKRKSKGPQVVTRLWAFSSH